MVVLPAIVLAAIGTAIALRTTPFFTQTRVGRDGRPFRFLKLRTLPPHFNPYADKYAVEDVELPWFSRTLRMLHLDELPQLFFVVSGKMSMVGPRPEMPYLHAQFDPAFASRRTSVRPGCTGLWQISEFCEGMIHEHPEIDDYYVANSSFRFDLWILGRTLQLMLPFRAPQLVRMRELPSWARPAPRRVVAVGVERRQREEVASVVEA